MNYYSIYYKIHDREMDEYNTPAEITRERFNKYYRLITHMVGDNMEGVYRNMQGDVWSPNGEARDLIMMLGLSHTSMSVGDIIFCQNDQKYYYCSRIGFDEIKIL